MNRHDRIDAGLLLLISIILILIIPFFTWPDPRLVAVPPTFLWEISHFVAIIAGRLPFAIIFWSLLVGNYTILINRADKEEYKR